MKKIKIGYMCKTDYDYHLEECYSPTYTYKSIENLKEHRDCVETCGIVKVKIELDKVVQEDKFFETEQEKTKG